jgi:septal ring factor EnvC (AmiA/AmiB activator)
MTNENKDQSITGLLGWVQQKKEESQEKKEPWGWVTALLVTILAFFALALAAYDAWKKGREIAKLKHELDVKEEEKTQAEISAAIARQDQIQKAQKELAANLEKQIEKTKSQIEVVEQERKDIHVKIDKITNWSDLDALGK